MNDAIVIGGAALLAYLFSRRGSLVGVAPKKPVPMTPAVTPRGTVDLSKIADDMPYEKYGDVLLAGANDVGVMPAGFDEQVRQVAARIPLSAIQQKDMILASRLMGGNLDRNGEAFTPSTEAIHKAEDDIKAGKTVLDLFQSVLSFIPVYGALIKTALSFAANDMQAGINALEKGVQSGKQIRIIIDVQQATPTTKMVLGNPMTDCKHLDAKYCGFVGNATTQLGNTGAGMIARLGMLEEYLYLGPSNPIFEPDPSLPHCRLFTRTRSGYVLPWLSEELGASRNPPSDPYLNVSSWKDTVIRRAMCYRIFDLMISQFWPVYHDPLWMPGQLGNEAGATGAGLYNIKQPQTWSYHNPYFGDVWESTIPPYPGEDTFITVGGITYTHEGTPQRITSLAEEQATGDVQNIAALAILAQTAKAQQGAPGEDLSATPGVSQPSTGPQPSVGLTSVNVNRYSSYG